MHQLPPTLFLRRLEASPNNSKHLCRMALTMSHLHCRPWSQGRKFRPSEEGLETQAGPAAQHGSVIAGDNLFLQVVAPGGPGNAKAELLLPLVFTGPAELSPPPATCRRHPQLWPDWGGGLAAWGRPQQPPTPAKLLKQQSPFHCNRAHVLRGGKRGPVFGSHTDYNPRSKEKRMRSVKGADARPSI